MESPLTALAHAWRTDGPEGAAALCAPDAAWIVDGQPYEGQPAIAGYLCAISGLPARVNIFIRRAFHDLREPEWWAGEWVVRSASDDGQRWREIEQGVLLRLQGNQIAYLRIHGDHRSAREVDAGAPLRDEPWPAAIPAPTRTMTHDDILAVHLRHTTQGWARGDAETVVSCHAPDSLIQTPFEIVRGHNQLRRAVLAYYENYADTVITVHRVVYSGEYLAIHQTWTCTNRKTGIRAGDEDLNIGVLQDGKFWRWREYYDSRKSAQTLAQTVFGRP
jgi:ketosteroid isomerase-like protein